MKNEVNTVLYVLTFLPLLVALRGAPTPPPDMDRYIMIAAMVIAVPSCVLVIKRQVAGWQLTAVLLGFYGILVVGVLIQRLW